MTVRRLMFSEFTGGILPVAETRRETRRDEALVCLWISDLVFLHRRHTYEPHLNRLSKTIQ